jgi:hypothetical protein
MTAAPESRREAQRALRDASLELARLRRIRGASHRTWRRIARARRRLGWALCTLAAACLAEPVSAVDPLFRTGFVLPSTNYYGGASAAFADLDGDGDLDLYFGIWNGTTQLLLNTGSATAPSFAAGTAAPLPDIGSYAAPTFADIDGDGDLDAFIGTYTGNTVFLRNTGTTSAPAFAPAVTNPFGLADVGFLAAPTFGDLDADGDLDALVGESGGNVVYFPNTGSVGAPAFGAPATSPFGLADVGTGATPELVDVDGDGDLDVLTGAYGGGIFAPVMLFRNTGGATAPAFAAPVSGPFGLETVGNRLALAFGDVDGDGDFDAVVTAQDGQPIPFMFSFENTGSASAPSFTDAGNPFGLDHSSPNGPSNSMAFADTDADGDLDAYLQSFGPTRFQRNTGTPSAAAFTTEALPFFLAGDEPIFVDIDADGDLDQFSNGIFFRENTGSASSPAFAAAATNPFGLSAPGLHYNAPYFVDIDGDGDFDAFIGGRAISFFENTGTTNVPAFSAPLTNPFGLTSIYSYYDSPVFADFDGDGDFDALVGGTAADLVFFRNTGSATLPAFAPGVASPFGLFPVGGWVGWVRPETADIDGDGDLDLFVSDYFARVVFFENVLIDPEACTDGLDNDGDGRIDLGPGAGTDPGCASASDPSELGTKQCDNGLDDDGDGKVDFRPNGTGDPQCVGPLDDREAPDPPPPSGGCGIGPELLLLGPLLEAERRRRRRLCAAG